MSLFATRSIFRPLLVATAGALLLAAGGALADPMHGRGDRFGPRPDEGHFYHSPRGRDRGVVINWDTRPYWYTHRSPYYRPVVVYREPYPRYYRNYATFSPFMMSPAAYEVFEYTEPHMPVVVNQNTYSYTLTPGQVTDAGDGRYCREYQAKVVIGGRLQDSYGQACRQPDGSWEIVS